MPAFASSNKSLLTSFKTKPTASTMLFDLFCNWGRKCVSIGVVNGVGVGIGVVIGVVVCGGSSVVGVAIG